MASDFFGVRARPDTEIKWQFDNVTFVLNVIDVLAGVPDFGGSKRFTGRDHLRIDEFLPDETFLLTTRNDFPVLNG